MVCGKERNRRKLRNNLGSSEHAGSFHPPLPIKNQKYRLMLSLSKKSQRRITAFLALLKINNLQTTENQKMAQIKVFRQSRYVGGNLETPIKLRDTNYLLKI